MVSGGIPLALNWTRSPSSSVLTAPVPEHAADPWAFTALFLDDRRMIRARFPNGMPEHACYKFDHGSGPPNCPGQQGALRIWLQM